MCVDSNANELHGIHSNKGWRNSPSHNIYLFVAIIEMTRDNIAMSPFTKSLHTFAIHTYTNLAIIVVSLSKPHTSESNGA